MICSDHSSSKRNNWNWVRCCKGLTGWSGHKEIKEILICLTKWNESYVGYGLHLQTQVSINRREAEAFGKGHCCHENNWVLPLKKFSCRSFENILLLEHIGCETSSGSWEWLGSTAEVLRWSLSIFPEGIICAQEVFAFSFCQSFKCHAM